MDNELSENEISLMKNELFQRKFYIRINLGLVTASFALFLGYLQVQDWNLNLYIGLVCFCLIFPINIYFGFISQLIDNLFPQKVILESLSTRTILIVTIITLLIAAFGLLEILFQFLNLAILAFIVGFIAVFILFLLFAKKTNEIKTKFQQLELEEERKKNQQELVRIEQEKIFHDFIIKSSEEFHKYIKDKNIKLPNTNSSLQ